MDTLLGSEEPEPVRWYCFRCGVRRTLAERHTKPCVCGDSSVISHRPLTATTGNTTTSITFGTDSTTSG
jgi:hypothetical protein